jgi:hypothetical protein
MFIRRQVYTSLDRNPSPRIVDRTHEPEAAEPLDSDHVISLGIRMNPERILHHFRRKPILGEGFSYPVPKSSDDNRSKPSLPSRM